MQNLTFHPKRQRGIHKGKKIRILLDFTLIFKVKFCFNCESHLLPA